MYLVTRRADGMPGESIQVSLRRSTADEFGRSREVAELGTLNMPQSLFLSADERTLLFNDGFSKDGTLCLMESRRSTLQGRWGTPMPLRFDPRGHKSTDLPLPHVGRADPRGRAEARTGPVRKRRFVTWTRKATDQPFAVPVPLCSSA